MTFLSPLLREPGRAWVLEDTATGARLASRIEGAFDSKSRRHGLLGRTGLVDTALIIAPCNAVHTFFMHFPIDVLFVDRHGRLVKICRDVRPWRMTGAWRGFATIEVAAGTADHAHTRTGHLLAITESSGASGDPIRLPQ